MKTHVRRSGILPAVKVTVQLTRALAAACLLLGATGGGTLGPHARAAGAVECAPRGPRVVMIGWVVDRYECPPCPKGALCKPCIGRHVRLSSRPPGRPPKQANTEITYDSAATTMVFGPRHIIDRMCLGERYRVTGMRRGRGISARLDAVAARLLSKADASCVPAPAPDSAVPDLWNL